MKAASGEHLRVLHVAEPTSGGVLTMVQHFVEQQASAGHEVHLLAPALMPGQCAAVHHRWSLDRTRPHTVVTAVRDLRRVVVQVRPDVIHLHSFVAGFLGRLPASLSWRGRLPVVYQPHAWSTELFTQRLLARGVAWAERSGARRTDVLVANCQDEIDRGHNLGITATGFPVGVPVDLDRFHVVSSAEREQYRERLGVGEDRMLLSLGRMGHQKGQDLLLSQWERSRPDHTLLALVGPGDTDILKTIAPTQWGRTIRAVGGVDDVRPWLWAADALVLPSRYETIGLVVAEAMATGLPVMATAVDGVRETVTGGDGPPAGSVVELGDMRSLLLAAQRRLNDAELWKAESMAGRQRAEAMFSPDMLAQRLDTAYRTAIAKVAGNGVSR